MYNTLANFYDGFIKSCNVDIGDSASGHDKN